jgi:membrane protease YdiL (CAAX protease family)
MSITVEASKSEPRVESVSVPQYNLLTILFMFAWPAAFYMFLIYVIAPIFFTPVPGEFLPTWIFLGVIALGGGAELIVALVLLRREGYSLTVDDLRDRLRLRWPKGRKLWGLALVALILAFASGMATAPLATALANVPGFVPPDWWPPMSNPTVEITDVTGFFPDVSLQGNYAFLVIFFLVGLVFNIVGEELYYRGFLLPRMHGVFGRWDWVANGIGFALKHIYQRWLYPALLIPGLAFAFVGGPVGSLWLAMIFHWIGNFLMAMVLLIGAVFGIG